MLRHILQSVILSALLGSSCFAQDWARKMFNDVEHDFGTIARGAKAEHEFVFTNRYVDEVRVAGVRASCGCTSLDVKNQTVATYDNGAIVSRINSSSFLGQRRATITVTFDKPHWAQVQLNVKVYVQSDVVFEPAAAVFGSVAQSQPAETVVSVSRRGRPDWKIVDIKNANPHLAAKVLDSRREGDRTKVRVKVSLADSAPAGRINEYLMLVTNDRGANQIAMAVEGEVVSELSASPGVLFLGVAVPGEKVTRNVVVRAKTPFRVLSIEPECDCLTATAPAAAEPRTFYVIPVTFTASGESRKVDATIHIKTDLAGLTTVDVAASAAVIHRQDR
ncbi:MAG: DUF1573 domain-containing protein [Pirellulaceae bacterium]|nr:DUF1573 domain-containing protein [Pirellulaceae bacterium]